MDPQLLRYFSRKRYSAGVTRSSPYRTPCPSTDSAFLGVAVGDGVPVGFREEVEAAREGVGVTVGALPPKSQKSDPQRHSPERIRSPIAIAAVIFHLEPLGAGCR